MRPPARRGIRRPARPLRVVPGIVQRLVLLPVELVLRPLEALGRVPLPLTRLPAVEHAQDHLRPVTLFVLHRLRVSLTKLISHLISRRH